MDKFIKDAKELVEKLNGTPNVNGVIQCDRYDLINVIGNLMSEAEGLMSALDVSDWATHEPPKQPVHDNTLVEIMSRGTFGMGCSAEYKIARAKDITMWGHTAEYGHVICQYRIINI